MKKLLLVFTLLLTFLISQELTVAAATPSQVIIINTAINKLAFYENGNLVKEFPVASGKSSTPTPQGEFLIVNKIKNRPYYKGGIPGGDPRNPLGNRWLGLNIYGTPGNTYAIHGNNNESSIGQWVSSGCVRMHNDDIKWLYDRINVSATVIIKKSQASNQEIAALYGISLMDRLPVGVVDYPIAGETLSESYNVSGWFLDESGVSKVEVLVDGAVVGRASYGDTRLDVRNVYPEYKNSNAGYHYALDTTKFSAGSHRITVRETGKNGKVTTLSERTVTILNAVGFLDYPVSNAKLTGSYNVSGWFLDGSGVSKVEVLVDGAVVGRAAYGDARPDVKNVFPAFKNGNAGYHYALDTTRLSNGNHRIAVRETGKNGKVTTLSERTVTILNAVGFLDYPVPNAELTGSYNVSGWFLDGSGVSKVEVLVDGAVVGRAVYGDARPDVKKVFPEYNNRNAGYHYVLDTTRLSNGNHRITVRETGKNGKVTTLPEKTVKISNDQSPPAVPIVNAVSDQDKTVIGTAEAGVTVTVKAGSKTYEGTAKADGTFTVAIAAQKAGMVLMVTATDKAGNVSAMTKVTVSAKDSTSPAAPRVNPVLNTDRTVSGKAEAGATVTVKAGSKTYKGTAKADGTFTVAMAAQKAGTALMVTAIDKAGNVSAMTKITVGK